MLVSGGFLFYRMSILVNSIQSPKTSPRDDEEAVCGVVGITGVTAAVFEGEAGIGEVSGRGERRDRRRRRG